MVTDVLRRGVAFGLVAGACMTTTTGRISAGEPEPDARQSIIAQAQVWRRTNVSAMDIKAGPPGEGALAFRTTVTCDYSDKKLGGRSPKFACRAGDDELKVKYGGANGEVYGEVLATRLLWALGYGADRMYPVTVICRGCPEELGGIERPAKESRFDPAIIERKFAGVEWPAEGKPGWSWAELDRAPAPGGATRAERDAFKLLAVFMQHSDSKPEQQSIVCLGNQKTKEGAHEKSRDACSRPFLLISDVGLTFGRASATNANSAASVNLTGWRQTPVWKEASGCIGNLPKSLTGTLDNPVIGEDGRRLLADQLMALTDRQLRDLFEVARVDLRLRTPGDTSSGLATIDEWVDAFKAKRAEIVERRCPAAQTR
jgi:hypothetical protein